MTEDDKFFGVSSLTLFKQYKSPQSDTIVTYSKIIRLEQLIGKNEIIHAQWLPIRTIPWESTLQKQQQKIYKKQHLNRFDDFKVRRKRTQRIFLFFFRRGGKYVHKLKSGSN